MATICIPDANEAVVLDQLHAIVSSHHFCNSKRYPALLEYSVRNTLIGDADKLRERQIGVELFGRKPGYDTNADPIVRVTAGEVRKRLAQYYQDHGHTAPIRIDLPSGSYVVEIHVTGKAQALPDTAFEERRLKLAATVETIVETPKPGLALVERDPQHEQVPQNPSQWKFIAGVVAIVAVAVIALTFYIANRNNAEKVFWSAFLGRSSTVPVVIGQSSFTNYTSIPDDSSLRNDTHQPKRFVSLGDASTAMTFCNRIATLSHSCYLLPSRSIDLAAIWEKPVIFIGGYNNPWVQKLTDSLRFGFAHGTSRMILDNKTSKPIGSVNFDLPRDQIPEDYSILARFHSDLTDSMVVIVAGVGPMGTQGAAEFLASPDRIRELTAAAPSHARTVNMEAVLATDVVGGTPGHTRIVATNFW